MARWGNAYSYRARTFVQENEKGEPYVVLPTEIVELIGARPDDELICVITDEGGILIRKL